MTTKDKLPFWRRAVDTVDQVGNTMVTVKTAVIVGSAICVIGGLGIAAIALSRTNIAITVHSVNR